MQIEDEAIDLNPALLRLPQSVAAELLSEGIVEPYWPEVRADPMSIVLITAAVSGTVSAATTVLVTRLTDQSLRRVARTLVRNAESSGLEHPTLRFERHETIDGVSSVVELPLSPRIEAQVLRILSDDDW